MFNEVYEKIAALEAIHEEEGFKAGFQAGIKAASEIIEEMKKAIA